MAWNKEEAESFLNMVLTKHFEKEKKNPGRINELLRKKPHWVKLAGDEPWVFEKPPELKTMTKHDIVNARYYNYWDEVDGLVEPEEKKRRREAREELRRLDEISKREARRAARKSGETMNLEEVMMGISESEEEDDDVEEEREE